MHELALAEVKRIRASSRNPDWVLPYTSEDGHETLIIDGDHIHAIAVYECEAGAKVVVQVGKLGDWSEVSNDFSATTTEASK